MKISTRLFSGFGLMCGIIVLCNVLGLFASQSTSGTIGTLVDTELAVQSEAMAALSSLRDARGRTQEFLRVRTLDVADETLQAFASSATAFEAVAAHATDSHISSEAAHEATAVHALAEKFEHIKDLWIQRGLTHSEGLQGGLRSAVHNVEELCKEHASPELSVKMLMCRRHEKDYLLRGAEKYLGRVADRIAEFHEIAAEQGMDEAVRSEFSTLFDDYYTKLAALVEADKAITIAETELIASLVDLETSALAMAGKADAAMTAGAEHAYATLDSQQTTLYFGLFGGVVVAIGVSLFCTRSIHRPIRRLLSQLQDSDESGAGGFTEIDVRGKDEIAELGHAFNGVLHDLNVLMEEARVAIGGIEESIVELNSASTELEEGAEGMKAQSASVSAASEELATGMTSMSSNADQVSNSITEVSGSVGELDSSIQEIAGNAARASQASRSVATLADESSEKMSMLDQAAEGIGRVIQVIQDIAEQTNLLALNATIEAARAGEAGKGFAVVANEVKDLAQQTAEATEDISKRVLAIQSSASDSVSSIESIVKAIDEVTRTSESIAAAVEEQSVATRGISDRMADASSMVGEVSSSVSQSAAASGEITQHTARVDQGASLTMDQARSVAATGRRVKSVVDQLKRVVSGETE